MNMAKDKGGDMAKDAMKKVEGTAKDMAKDAMKK